MIAEALKILSTSIVKTDVEWDNVFIPCSGVTDIDRNRHFTNINENLLKRVRLVKAD